MSKELKLLKPGEVLTKELVIHNFCNENGKFLSARTNKNYLNKYGFYDKIIEYYPDSESIQETLDRIVHDIDVRPVCKMCGSHLTYNKSNGFPTYCSPKCKNSDPDMIKKNAEGVSRALKKKYSEDKESIINKRKNTLKEKYDTDNPFEANVNHNKSTFFDELNDIIRTELGIDDHLFITNLKACFEEFIVDLFFVKKRKIIMFNDSYAYTTNMEEKYKTIEYILTIYELDYIIVAKPMYYKERDKFVNIIRDFYNGTLEVEDRTKMFI